MFKILSTYICWKKIYIKCNIWRVAVRPSYIWDARLLTLYLLTWRIWWAPNNASNRQIVFNSAFKGLEVKILNLLGRSPYRSFESSVSGHQLTRRNISEDLSLQQPGCQNFILRFDTSPSFSPALIRRVNSQLFCLCYVRPIPRGSKGESPSARVLSRI